MQKPARSKSAIATAPLLRAGFCKSSRADLKFAIIVRS